MGSLSSGDEEEAELAPRDKEDHEEEEEDSEEDDQAHKKVSKKVSEKRKEKLLQEIAKAKDRGVCYLSRIPPHLKPLKLRHFLSQYSEVLRIYLAPEDPAARLRRKMAGKNSGKNFTEGWVEFANKKDAKKIAKMLNGEPMGGKKRSAYYYDLWNIRYLRNFKWDNLTEEIAYRNAVREQKQAADISAAKRERDFYLAKVDQSKAIAAMEERKTKKQKSEERATAVQVDTGGAPPSKIVRHFPQKRSVTTREGGDAPRLSRDILAAVLGRR